MRDIDPLDIKACLDVTREGSGVEQLAGLKLAKLHSLIDWVCPTGSKAEKVIGEALVAMVQAHLARLAFADSQTLSGARAGACEQDALTLRGSPVASASGRWGAEALGLRTKELIPEVGLTIKTGMGLLEPETHLLERVAALLRAAEDQFDADLAAGTAIQVRAARVAPTDDYAGIMQLDPVVYGSSPAKPLWEAEELRALSRVFPEGALVAANRRGTVLGYCIVLPVRPSFVSDYLSGKRRADAEWNFFQDSLTAQEAREAPAVYALLSDICAFPLPTLRLHAALGFARELKRKLHEYPNCDRACAIVVSTEGKRLDRMFRSFLELEQERDNGEWGLFRVWKLRTKGADCAPHPVAVGANMEMRN